MRQGSGFINVEAVRTVELNIVLPNGSIKLVKLEDVYYLLDLYTNLLSCRRLRTKGAVLDMASDTFFDRNGLPFGTARLTEQHWEVVLEHKGPPVASAFVAVTTELLHQRMGHPGFSTLKETAKHVDGIDIKLENSHSSCETLSLIHISEPTRPY